MGLKMTPSFPLFVALTIILQIVSQGGGTHAQLTFARVDSLTDAVKYLVQFGYLKDLKEVASLLTPSLTGFDPTSPASSTLRLALSKFQQYARLPVTGKFDTPTKQRMNTPRCGNKDILQIDVDTNLNLNDIIRRKRFVTSSFKWQKRELTYRLSKFSEGGFSPQVTLREVDQAFEIWGNATNLYFVRADGESKVDIDMRFARKAHGDVEPFDGRGITLAHAFPPGPEIGGDVHFDDDEDWTSGVYRGTNFLHVVVHELGHALGLRHSDVEDAIMYAFARPYEPVLRLHEDDIQGIQSLYGEKRQSPDAMSENKDPSVTERPLGGGGSSPSASSAETQTMSTSTEENTSTSIATATSTTTRGPFAPETKPDLCKDSKIDAITALADGWIYALKGDYAFRIDPNGGGIMHRYTEKISYVFYGLPGNIDAALTHNEKTYFFKGRYYWRYVNRKLDGVFPRLIATDFPGIPDSIDAALTWSGDNQMYFFKGDKYWSFHAQDKPQVARNYPLPISQWYGLPTKDLDAGFTSPNGPTYFFKDQHYWLFDDDNFEVAETDPPYPRPTRVMWFGCTAYRPDPSDLRRGWLGRTVDKLKGAVRDVMGHVDDKFKKITGWIF